MLSANRIREERFDEEAHGNVRLAIMLSTARRRAAAFKCAADHHDQLARSK
jgi:hypothetical protein